MRLEKKNISNFVVSVVVAVGLTLLDIRATADTVMSQSLLVIHTWPTSKVLWSKKISWNRAADTPQFNSLRPRQNGRHFPDDIFKWIFLNENVWIFIKRVLNFLYEMLFWWISYYILNTGCDIMTHHCPKFSNSLIKLKMKLGYG